MQCGNIASRTNGAGCVYGIRMYQTDNFPFSHQVHLPQLLSNGWLVGSGVKAKRRVVLAKKCTVVSYPDPLSKRKGGSGEYNTASHCGRYHSAKS